VELGITREPTRKFPSVLRDPKVRCRINKSSPLVPILSQTNPAQSPFPLYKILLLHLRLGRPSGLFPSGFPTNNLHTFLFSPIHATCPAHFILLNLIILIKLGEEYKSRSSSLCSFPHTPVSSSLFGANTLSAPCSQKHSV
jgi:hypothetical protein